MFLLLVHFLGCVILFCDSLWSNVCNSLLRLWKQVLVQLAFIPLEKLSLKGIWRIFFHKKKERMKRRNLPWTQSNCSLAETKPKHIHIRPESVGETYVYGAFFSSATAASHFLICLFLAALFQKLNLDTLGRYISFHIKTIRMTPILKCDLGP